MAVAYKVRVSEVSGPGWISELRFNVEAKLPAGSDTKTSNEMLQRLLEQRFGLRTHRETRSVPGFVLTVAQRRRAPHARCAARFHGRPGRPGRGQAPHG